MIVVVLGMHRSGTSALSGLLHTNGIIMGRDKEFFPPPQIQNPKGFFENRRFREINDNLLRCRNYNVKQFDPNVPTIDTCFTYKPEMIELINDYEDEFENWGFKDPRTCLTLAAWLEVFRFLDLEKKLRIIFLVRPFGQIANSMRVRNNKEREEGQFIDLSYSYYGKALSACNGYERMSVMFISFRELLKKTDETCLKLEDFLGVELRDTSFVDPKISGMSPQNRKRLLRSFGLRADGKPREELLNADKRANTSNDPV